ncbi:RNA polymerase sigma factor [Austwickia sp. TVS 96-490-7B]|uniref:RNA polymerase sigma factor n=1 Tax=Austwickia sp. TVS 96-490-7B TaxID=2830843 RepID=UPI001C5943FC|nr:hypothetical protein [Austwickia sp. TVS 96-490-7B]
MPWTRHQRHTFSEYVESQGPDLVALLVALSPTAPDTTVTDALARGFLHARAGTDPRAGLIARSVFYRRCGLQWLHGTRPTRPDLPAPGPGAATHDRVGDLRTAFLDLPPHVRLAVLLRSVEAMPEREAARLARMPVHTLHHAVELAGGPLRATLDRPAGDTEGLMQALRPGLRTVLESLRGPVPSMWIPGAWARATRLRRRRRRTMAALVVGSTALLLAFWPPAADPLGRATYPGRVAATWLPWRGATEGPAVATASVAEAFTVPGHRPRYTPALIYPHGAIVELPHVESVVLTPDGRGAIVQPSDRGPLEWRDLIDGSTRRLHQPVDEPPLINAPGALMASPDSASVVGWACPPQNSRSCSESPSWTFVGRRDGEPSVFAAPGALLGWWDDHTLAYATRPATSPSQPDPPTSIVLKLVDPATGQVRESRVVDTGPVDSPGSYVHANFAPGSRTLLVNRPIDGPTSATTVSPAALIDLTDGSSRRGEDVDVWLSDYPPIWVHGRPYGWKFNSGSSWQLLPLVIADGDQPLVTMEQRLKPGVWSPRTLEGPAQPQLFGDSIAFSTWLLPSVLGVSGGLVTAVGAMWLPWAAGPWLLPLPGGGRLNPPYLRRHRPRLTRRSEEDVAAG